MESLNYDDKQSPYIIPDINLQTSQILIARNDAAEQEAIQLAEVEVYGWCFKSKYTVIQPELHCIYGNIQHRERI